MGVLSNIVGNFAKFNRLRVSSAPVGSVDVVNKAYGDSNYGNSVVSQWDGTDRATDFTAVSGQGYDVSDVGGIAPVAVSAPTSPSAGDEVGIRGTSAIIPPVISSFSGLTMQAEEVAILRFMGDIDEWFKVGEA